MIREWITENIKGGRLQSGGREYVCPSLFEENDWKRHMSINLDTGLWQCFKSGEKGGFYKLVMLVRGCSYGTARSIVGKFCIDRGELNFDDQELRIHKPESGIVDDSAFHAITPDSPAEDYILSRGLNPADFMACTSGPFSGRLIIPYTDEFGMYYFNARALGDQFPKYLNPPQEVGVKASHVLFPYDDQADVLYVTEGAIDALSLKQAGVEATCTNGSSPSHIQGRYLKEFKGRIVVAYDNDEAGREGVERFERMRKRLCMPEISYVFPPAGYKDWNSLLVEEGGPAVKQALLKETRMSWENNILSAL
jgi:hypothetical protein